LDKTPVCYGNSHDHNRISQQHCGLLLLFGTATMILFFVFAAILKVVCEEFEELKPIALITEK
jgi:hypothetical protein